ncbi:MAG: hypothetical protein ABIR06_07620 [Cyclobacteriaceae bacterium]
MKTFRPIYVAFLLTALRVMAHAQGNDSEDQPTQPNKKLESVIGTPSLAFPKAKKVTIITGARFSYPLVQKWIDRYNLVNPNIQIIIESRGSTDPAQYDILAEVYEQEEEIKKDREYINVARYAILPVANDKSAFAKNYADKGLNKALINQVFFHDLYAEKEDIKKIKAPYTVYTRLQKAGVPIVFTKYFGFEQKDIKGKAIAGADEHLLKALLRDSTGVSYLPLALIYDLASKKPLNGIAVLPVDLNGNGRINDDEKFYDNLEKVIQRLEHAQAEEIHNIPMAYLHLSFDKAKAGPETIDFLKWIIENGQSDLHEFGYLQPEADSNAKVKVSFASKDK